MMKENGADEDDETNEQENDSRQSIIENGEKEIVKQWKRQNTQLEEKKNRKREVEDSKPKSKLVSVRSQITQPSRYSESSTQTLRVDGEPNANSPKKQHGATDTANTREGSPGIRHEAGTGKNKPLWKTAPNIRLQQLTQTPTNARIIMLAKQLHTAPSIRKSSTMPTMQAVKSHHPIEDNPSISGSSGSQYKSCNTSERMQSEVGKNFIFSINFYFYGCTSKNYLT